MHPQHQQLSDLRAQTTTNGMRDEAQHRKGKLTARERIELLVDRGSFVELDQFVLHDCQDFGMAEKKIHGDGVITGFARIDGRNVYLFAQDATVFGGSLSATMAKKICKVMELAMNNGAPLIGINDSGGARIHEGVASLAGYADIFYRNVQASGVVPQLSLIVGPCAGGAVYSPAMTDAIFMVDGISHMFITGPDVIKEVTGEEIDFAGLGGSQIHTRKSGVCDLRFSSEVEIMHAARRWLSYLPSHAGETPPTGTQEFDPAIISANARDLETLVPQAANLPYDMQTLIAKVVDPDSLFVLKPEYAPNIVIALARLQGMAVGVIGNNPHHLAGVLDSEASIKAARFVRFCDLFNLPLLTFIDVPGFLPGVTQEHQGIIRHGAKLLYAYCEASVPKLTVIVRKAYGGAYDVMSSKHIGGDFNCAWPNAEIAVMGSEGACNIIFKKEIAQADDPRAKRQELIAAYQEKFSNPWIAAQKGFVDAVIFPSETRSTLCAALDVVRNKKTAVRHKKHSNIPL